MNSRRGFLKTLIGSACIAAASVVYGLRGSKTKIVAEDVEELRVPPMTAHSMAYWVSEVMTIWVDGKQIWPLEGEKWEYTPLQ